MSDEKQYTERDVVLREREAWRRGVAMERNGSTQWNSVAELYPLPKITRQREVTGASGRRYKLWPAANGVKVYEHGQLLHDMGCRVPHIPLVDVPALADLLANPTETVEVEP